MKIDELMSAANAGVNQTSVQKDLGDQNQYSIQVAFSSATLNGTVVLEGSIDNITYGEITGTSKTVTSGAAQIYNVADGNYRYVRAKWTYTSGSGTITVKSLVKEITPSSR